LKQVHLVPRWDSKEGKETRAIQVSIDGFRSIAESSGHYAGNEDPIYDGEQEIEYGAFENKKPIRKKLIVPLKATVTIYKMVDGQKCPFVATARWSEYYPGERIGFQWHIRPYLMLGKCAEALTLRKAFPKLLSGMYSAEELDRTVPMDMEAQKTQKGFSTLMELIGKSTIAELQDWMKKIEKSDKYTEDQKAEFLDKADKRIVELKTDANIN
jgi:phage recombination protein Bet